MKKAWSRLLAAIDGRSLRERALLLTASLAVIVLLADALFIEPARQAYKADQAKLSEARSRVAGLEASEVELRTALSADPDAEAKARIAALRGAIAQADGRLAEAVARFIPADRMHVVLRTLITQTGGLHLQALRSLPSAALNDDSPGDATDPVEATISAPEDVATRVWKRGVELELRGSYAALNAYLHTVEQQPWLLNWDLLSIDGTDYPNAAFILRLHTLSLDKEWIGV